MNSHPALSCEELLNYVVAETERWRQWFEKNPATLDLKVNIAEVADVRHVIVHIFAVDMRYAQRLVGEEALPWEQALETIPLEPIEALFGASSNALNKMRSFIASATPEDWNQQVRFGTLSSGSVTASKRKCFVHSLLHGIRHWGQLATALRAAGFKQDWQHDFVFTEAMK